MQHDRNGNLEVEKWEIMLKGNSFYTNNSDVSDISLY